MPMEENRRKRKTAEEEPSKAPTRIRIAQAHPTPFKINVQRCTKCGIQLRLTNTFKCKCSAVFCPKHRYPDEHGCTYDYKLENRIRLEKENPKIISPEAWNS